MRCRTKVWTSRQVRRRSRVPREEPLETLGPTLWLIGDRTALVRVNRELQSPNKTLWAHWRRKMADRHAWEEALAQAYAVACSVASPHGLQLAANALPGTKRVAPPQRYTVRIRRLVPRRACFIRDDDNLMFAAKGLRDALKALGFIYDDARAWLEQPPIEQRVSADGRWWTEIEITPWVWPLGPGAIHEDTRFRDLQPPVAEEL